MPAILHWNMNHFVVLERVARGRALIHNPDGRSRYYTMAELSRHFTGVALELLPADSSSAATCASASGSRNCGAGCAA